MKITKDRLVFIIKEEHQKVKIINEVMNSAEYQRLVEIVGKEKADVIVEGFFDFDWVPGSEANKMRKILNALEAAENEEEIAAIFDQLPDDQLVIKKLQKQNQLVIKKLQKQTSIRQKLNQMTKKQPY